MRTKGSFSQVGKWKLRITLPYHEITLENSSLKVVVEPNASLAFRKDWEFIQLLSVSTVVICDNRIGAGVFVRVVSPQAVEGFWGGTSWLQMPNYLLGDWCPGESIAKNVPRMCESRWNITQFKMKIQSSRRGRINVSFHGQSSAVQFFHSAWGGNRKRKQPFNSNLIQFLAWTIQAFWSVHI